MASVLVIFVNSGVSISDYIFLNVFFGERLKREIYLFM